jgi:hypothetical protein
MYEDMDSSVAGCSEQSSEASACINGGELLDQPSDYQLFTASLTPWS